MPIPASDPAATTPRRLLRDVAIDQLLAAIVDGTLEPGERLNDDELAKWLQVSRTPIQEAIAQLQTYGLVEIEANRYTKVAARDGAAYAEAAQFLAGLHSLAREWSTGNLDTAARKEIRRALAAATKSSRTTTPRALAHSLMFRVPLRRSPETRSSSVQRSPCGSG